ncbi:MAG: DUF4055 domain-containing protein, partial [bacterium]|nr:DUF4055 domain-containing protein [bacterium]
IGAGKSIDSNNADAKFAWVEHKGTAIASGRTHGLDIQDKMEALKAKARNRTGGDPKAMIAAIAEERGMSSLETWALDSGDAAELAYHKMAEFIGKQMPADFKVTVTTKNLALDPRADAKVEILRKVRADGNLSRETLLNEMRRHASVSEDLDVPAELERIKQEGMDAADEFLRTTTAAPEVDENGDEVQPKPTLSTPPAA